MGETEMKSETEARVEIMAKRRVGILAATGAVGQQFVRFLVEHPFFELKLLTASKKSAGKRYCEATTWLADFTPEGMPRKARNMIVEDTTIENIERAKLDIVFSALPSEIALKILPELASKGIMVIDKSSAFRFGIPKLGGGGEVYRSKVQDHGSALGCPAPSGEVSDGPS